MLWHGWLPKLSGVNGASPWAADASESAGYLVEVCAWSVTLLVFLQNGVTSVEFDAVEAASLLPDYPNVWTDGSLVLDQFDWCFLVRCWVFCSSALFPAGSGSVVGAMLIRVRPVG